MNINDPNSPPSEAVAARARRIRLGLTIAAGLSLLGLLVVHRRVVFAVAWATTTPFLFLALRFTELRSQGLISRARAALYTAGFVFLAFGVLLLVKVSFQS